MVAAFLAPVSGGIRISDKGNLVVSIGMNEARAQILPIQIKISKNVIGNTSASFLVEIENTESSGGFFTAEIYSLKDPQNPVVIGNEQYSFSAVSKQTVGICFGEKVTPCTKYDTSKLEAGTRHVVQVFIVKNLSTTIKASTEFTTGNSGNPGDIIEGTSKIGFDTDYGCGVLNLDACVAQLLHGVVFTLLSALATVAAGILDFFVYYSTNSDSYTAEFVQKGWQVVRDIANIFFIITLLYIAIKTILGLNVTDNKKLVSMVILMGLIINFSLFTSKVVIDSTNILAKIFYNNIEAKDRNGRALGAEGEKSITVGLVSKFNPQTIVGTDFNIVDKTSQFILITILSCIMMFVMIYMFISISFLFVSRVVSLWLCMIFSPIAFLSYATPFEMPGFGHKEWWGELLKNAFLAPLFIFFLYLIIMFADFLKNITYDTGANATITQTIMKTIIPFFIIFILLDKAKDLAVKYSGELGAKMSKAGNAVAGLATAALGGAMIGSAAKLMQGGAGHLGKKIFDSKGVADWATKTDEEGGSRFKRFAGSKFRALAGGDDGKGGLAGSSFDLRKGLGGGLLGAISGATGVDMGKGSKIFGETGGYMADLKRKDDKRKRIAEGLGTKETEDEKQKLNQYQEEHQELSIKNSNAVHDLDVELSGAEKARRNLEKIFNAAANKTTDKDGNFIDPTTAKKQKDFADASQKVHDLQRERSIIKNGIGVVDKDGNVTYRTHNGNITEDEYKGSKKALEKIEEEKTATAKSLLDAELRESQAIERTKNAKKAREEAEENARKGAPGNATLAEAVADAIKAEKKINAELETTANNTQRVAKALESIEKTERDTRDWVDRSEKAKNAIKEKDADGNVIFGNSQNNYEDTLLPHQLHAVDEVGRERKRRYATNMEEQWALPWNKEARAESAHAIRMGAKPEKDHGGGKHDDLGVLGHLAIEGLGQALSGHGHEKEGDAKGHK